MCYGRPEETGEEKEKQKESFRYTTISAESLAEQAATGSGCLPVASLEGNSNL